MSSIADVEMPLEERVAAIAAEVESSPQTVSVATRQVRRSRAEQLSLIAAVVGSGEFDRLGYRSPTDWLVATTGESAGRCKGDVSIARRLGEMPMVWALFARGLVPESSLRLLVEVWHEDIAASFAQDEELLARWATKLAQGDFKLVVETWRRAVDPDCHDRNAHEQFDKRNLHLSGLLDGMGRLDGLLDPEGMLIVKEAIRVLSQRGEDDTRTPGQCRADALVEMAKHALADLEADPQLMHPSPGAGGNDRPDGCGEPTAGDRSGDAVVESTKSAPTAPRRGRSRRRRRPKVIATISWRDLVAGSGGGTLDTGAGRAVVSAETIRRLACDAELHRYLTGPDDSPINYGRSRRVVSDAQFDRLMVRDHGCRLGPGCGVPAAWCEAHHVNHWTNGGLTDDDELILGCWYHHRRAHEEHWRIEPLGAGRFQVTKPNGHTVTLRPPLLGLTIPGLPVLV